MQTINYKLVGQKIKEKRNKLGMTQEQLAERCEISVSYIAHIERGTKSLSLETAVKISNTLGISLDYLILDEINMRSRALSAMDTELAKCEPKQAAAFLRLTRLLLTHINEI
ncbi:MAG: helix-turn-helix transcriptional regulator [Oscillospiraceae bacterium]|nr:helix-turn-helix transcriptional regulator [Oscillospiraceae bacterium]